MTFRAVNPIRQGATARRGELAKDLGSVYRRWPDGGSGGRNGTVAKTAITL